MKNGNVKFKVNNPIRVIKTTNGGKIISGKLGNAGLRN